VLRASPSFSRERNPPKAIAKPRLLLQGWPADGDFVAGRFGARTGDRNSAKTVKNMPLTAYAWKSIISDGVGRCVS
jgi:hypothetical protein